MKAVIFDLDNTILDRDRSLSDFIKWQAESVLRLDKGIRSEFLERFIELDNGGKVWKDKVYKCLVQEFNIDRWRSSELLQIYELCFCAFCQPIDGAILAIKGLKEAGYAIGLISNGRSPFQERNFEALGIRDLFSSVIVSEAVGMRKPEKAIFDLSCNELSVPAHKAIFVGDNPIADIRGASEAGLKTIFLSRKSGKKCEFSDATFTHYSELGNLVKTII